MKSPSRLRVHAGVLLLCGLLMFLTYHLGFAARYSLDEFGSRPRQTIGMLSEFSNEGAYVYIGSMIALFTLFALGYEFGVKPSIPFTARQRRGMLVLIVSGGAAFSLVLLQMYPVDAADIYDYIMRGRMSAVYGLNPLEDVPHQVPNDPFYRFAAWKTVPSAYGPVWEQLAHLTSAVTAVRSPTEQVIAYKLLAVGGYAITAIFIGLTLQQIAPRRLLAGMYLFAWNPLVIYMTAGTGHNDAVMTACIAAALYCLSRRWYLSATLSAVLGALVKFIPVLLLPVIALMALRQLGVRRWLRYVIISGLLGGVLTTAFYAPYWHGLDTLRTERRAVMYTGSVAAVAREWLMPLLDGVTDLTTRPSETPITTALIANGTLVVFGLYSLTQLLVLWHQRDIMTAIRIIGRILLAYLLIASIWFHAWYVIWLVAPIALLEDTPLRRLTLVFSYLVTWQSFTYNYLIIQTRAGLWLPWLDLVPVAIYMGYVWAYLIRYAIQVRAVQRQSDPQLRQDGARLLEARTEIGATLSDLSDELNIPYDHLVQYERGTRPMRLDHARALAQRLGIPPVVLLGANKA